MAGHGALHRHGRRHGVYGLLVNHIPLKEPPTMATATQSMWSLQPSLAQDIEFLREICRVLVGLYRGVAFQ
jgi:hypothetical protein